jgi:DNA-damage-inducible protein D
MKKELIAQLFNQFEQAAYMYKGIECWSARELQQVLGYAEWRNFLKVIDKGMAACNGAGVSTKDHFVETNKMVQLGSGSAREIGDIALTRYACYLIAQNGDAAKPSIAFAQTYFAVQTRKQELVEQRLLDVERVAAREKLSKSEKKLSGILFERGVDGTGFAIIKSKGDQALFGGFNTTEMKRKLNVPTTKPLADFLPTLTIKAKDFANELTSHNVTEKDLHGQQQITQEHVDNNKAVRNILLQRGVKPEALKANEDVKKVERRLESEGNKIAKQTKKKK